MSAGCRQGVGRVSAGCLPNRDRHDTTRRAEIDRIRTKRQEEVCKSRPNRHDRRAEIDRIDRRDASSTPNRDRIGTKRQEEVCKSRPNRPNRRAEIDRIDGTRRRNRHETTRRNRQDARQLGDPSTLFCRASGTRSSFSQFFSLHCAFLQKSCKKGGCFFPPLRSGGQKKVIFFQRKVILFHRKVREKSEKSQRKVIIMS